MISTQDGPSAVPVWNVWKLPVTNHLFDQIAARIAGPAARFLETPAGEIMTYGDLWARSARMANVLTALGVGPGDRVAVQIEKTPLALALYIACIRAGAVFLPLNTAYTPHEISYFLGDAEPRVFVCDPARLESLKEIAATAGVAHVETMDRDGAGSMADLAAKAAEEFMNCPRGPDDMAAILYTSGTTGRSKGAMLSHANLASNARTLAEIWRFTEKDVLLHALPIFHTHGLFVATNIVLMTGGAMLFLARFDPDEVLRLMPRATAMMGVPTFYTRLLEHPGLNREVTSHMRLFVSGSAPLLAETHRAWKTKTGHDILERYGMTETNMNTSNPYTGDRIAGTVGRALPGVELRITDPETGKLLPTGDIGMIEVRGPNVFSGYWRMPEKTKAEFREDGFFITGDLGRVDKRGYVQIVGRGKDLIITGGFNVYPKEVETEIDGLKGVVESAVIGLEHPDFGEGVTAVVVTNNAFRLDEAKVIATLEKRIAKFKCPKRVFFVADLPRNAMGKVQKNLLREQYKGLYAKG
jgi:malonyl-CoA/methylmalonyl-CoA synthetase